MSITSPAVSRIVPATVPRIATTARTRAKATSRSRPARPAARGAIGGRPASTTSRRSMLAHAVAHVGSSTTVPANSQVSQPAVVSATRYAAAIHDRRAHGRRVRERRARGTRIGMGSRSLLTGPVSPGGEQAQTPGGSPFGGPAP